METEQRIGTAQTANQTTIYKPKRVVVNFQNQTRHQTARNAMSMPLERVTAMYSQASDELQDTVVWIIVLSLTVIALASGALISLKNNSLFFCLMNACSAYPVCEHLLIKTKYLSKIRLEAEVYRNAVIEGHKNKPLNNESPQVLCFRDK